MTDSKSTIQNKSKPKQSKKEKLIKINLEINRLELEKEDITGAAVYVGICVFLISFVIPLFLLLHSVPLLLNKIKHNDQIKIQMKQLEFKRQNLLID